MIKFPNFAQASGCHLQRNVNVRMSDVNPYTLVEWQFFHFYRYISNMFKVSFYTFYITLYYVYSNQRSGGSSLDCHQVPLPTWQCGHRHYWWVGDVFSWTWSSLCSFICFYQQNLATLDKYFRVSDIRFKCIHSMHSHQAGLCHMSGYIELVEEY